MKVLLTGGAGYIGSHTIVEMHEAGHDVVVVDNFSNSSPKAVARVEKIIGKSVPLYEADVADEAAMDRIFAELQSSFIAGLSLLGGEPLEPQNQAALYPFIQEVKRRFPEKTIWCYTGYVLDEKNGNLKERRKNTAVTKELISMFDVLVDGPFIERLKDIRLKFRGSSNQRVIDLQKTLQEGKCVLYLE